MRPPNKTDVLAQELAGDVWSKLTGDLSCTTTHDWITICKQFNPASFSNPLAELNIFTFKSSKLWGPRPAMSPGQTSTGSFSPSIDDVRSMRQMEPI